LNLCETDETVLLTDPIKRQRDTTLCRAAIVLLCSHMEHFFEETIKNVLEFHELNGTTIGALPMRLRVEQYAFLVKGIEAFHPEKRMENIMAAWQSKISRDDDVCSKGLLIATPHVGNFSNPGSEDVSKLYESIGVGNVWSLVNKGPHDQDLKARLDGLVARRNQIAHGEFNSIATRTDIEEYQGDMRDLSHQIDELIANHLKKIVSVNVPWDLFQ